MRQPAVLLATLFSLSALTGCVSSGPTSPTASGPGPHSGPADSTGGAASCTSAIARFEKVVSSDVEVGHLDRSVYNRLSADMNGVKASCAAGHDAEARAKLAHVRARYGYP